MRASSSPVKDGFVYKRRKMSKDTSALSGRNEAEVTEKHNPCDFSLSSSDYHLALHEDTFDDVQEAVADYSSDCEDCEKPSYSGRNQLDVHTTFKSQLFDCKNLESVPTCTKNRQSSVREVSHSTEGFTNELCSSSTGNCNVTNYTFATMGSYVQSASVLTVPREYSGELLNSSAIPSKSVEMLESLDELGIDVLKTSGLLGERRKSACVSPGDLGSVGPVFSPCKICGFSENALKMLICDACEEAFHLSCCRPKIKKLPMNAWHAWYCQSCFTTKPKPLLRKNTGTSLSISDATSESGCLISSMLRDIRPHRSRARVGVDFQVEVPDWPDLIPNNDDYFGEPKEMEHIGCCSLEGWSWSKPSKSSSIGNWLQCKDEDHRGNICGKWRRAPLFSIQTDDWDCSCALRWDPIHADCSVQQELDTVEVLKHLKYVGMLKSRVNTRTKSSSWM